MRKIVLAWLLLALGLAACQPASAAVSTETVASRATFTTVYIPPTATARLEATNTTAAPLDSQLHSIWLADSVPQALREALEQNSSWTIAADEADARLRLMAYQAYSSSAPVSHWVYALAAPFPTVADEVALDDVKAVWKGTPLENTPFTTLLVEPSTAEAFTIGWGKPSSAVQVKPAAALLDAAWGTKNAWAIIPFEQLEPRWKVIAVDGQSPVRKDFILDRYGLVVKFVLVGAPTNILVPIRDQLGLPESNRQPDHLTTVMVTGVTALVRGTASLMEQRGMDYPAQDIGGWLREADIPHISNEVPFWKTCPEPYNWEGLAFCSRTKYIELLRDVGADVIELTGDHFQDWGAEAMLFTLDLYRQEGWKTYGGGANSEEARQPALFEHNGNKIAFIGCNAKPKGYATAGPKTPGALHCNMEQMAAEVRKLREDGYQPIVTFQHLEYYSYTAHPILQKDFRQMAEAGAVIVSGSQAHQPHPIEFKDGAILHYGLGNLFFDQTNQGDAPRDAFIDRHVFYNGRLISTELLTIHLVDYARSRPMTPDERQGLLKTIFKASGWENGTRPHHNPRPGHRRR
jgi:poly-gamma-glutamate synthesis protein (capsule biosynthesis protein)